MTIPRLIRQIAVAAGLAWWVPALLATPTGEFEELSACLKRLPVHVTPNQVGAEGKISMADVALFHLDDGIADNLTYSTELIFFNGKWMHSVLRITQQKGEKLEANGTGLFETVCLYFKHHLGPAKQYTITSEIREDEDSGSTNRCVFWRNDLTGFVIDLDYQGRSVVTLNLRVMSLDYYSDNGFLGERIRGFYNDKVFPDAGVLPAGFPAKWERDAAKESTSTDINSGIASGVALLCQPLAANGEFDTILGLLTAETAASSAIETHLDINEIPRNLTGAPDDDRMMQSLDGFTLLGLQMAGYAIFRDRVCVGFRINSEELAPDAALDVAGVFAKSVAGVTDVMGKGIPLDDVPWVESGSEVMLSEVLWFHTNEVVVVSHQLHAGDPQRGRITFSRETIQDFAADTGIAENQGDLASYYRDELEWDIVRVVSLRWEKMQTDRRGSPGLTEDRGEASKVTEPLEAGDPTSRSGLVPPETETLPVGTWLTIAIAATAVLIAILLFRKRLFVNTH